HGGLGLLSGPTPAGGSRRNPSPRRLSVLTGHRLTPRPTKAPIVMPKSPPTKPAPSLANGAPPHSLAPHGCALGPTPPPILAAATRPIAAPRIVFRPRCFDDVEVSATSPVGGVSRADRPETPPASGDDE